MLSGRVSERGILRSNGRFLIPYSLFLMGKFFLYVKTKKYLSPFLYRAQNLPSLLIYLLI